MVASVELRQLAADMNRLEQQFRDLSTPQLGHSAIMGGTLSDFDTTHVLRGMIGEQFDGTHGVVMVNGPVPPVPSDPVAQTAVGGFIVRWDGLFRNADGATDITVIAPEDWTRNEVHVGTTEDFSPDFADTLEGTMESPRGPSVFVAADPGTYWIKMYSRSSSGKRSAATPAVSVTVEALNAGLPAEIDAAETRIVNAGSILLDELTTLTGKLGTQDSAIGTAATTATLDGLSAGAGTITESVVDRLWADVTVARMSVAEAFIGENAILTGAITAPKITASEEMWAAVLGAHKVTADEADLGSFTANTGFVADLEAEIMTADVFNGREFLGGTFTGATFRTDAGATVGVKLDTAGFRVYKADAAVFNATAAGDIVMTGVVNTSGSLANQFYTGFVDVKFGMFQTKDPQPNSVAQDVVGISFTKRTAPATWPAGLHSPDGEQIVLTSANVGGDQRAMLSMASWGAELFTTAGMNLWSMNAGIDLHGLQGVWIDGGNDYVYLYSRGATAGLKVRGTACEMDGGMKIAMNGPHPNYTVNFLQSSHDLHFTIPGSATVFQNIKAKEIMSTQHLTLAGNGGVLRFLDPYAAGGDRVYVQAPTDIYFTGNSAPTTLVRLVAASLYNAYGGTYIRGEGEVTVNGNSTGATWGSRIYDGRFAQSFGIRSDASCYVQSPPVYARTTTAAANVNVSTAGTIWRSTSSTKYKVAIQKLDVDEAGEDALLGLELKTWFDRLEAEAVAELQTEIVEAKRGVDRKGRPEKKPNDNAHIPDMLRRIPGLLAEDVEKILPAFVEHGPDGSVEAIMYERLAMLWIPVVRRLKARTISLENQIKAIESRLTKAGIK